MHVTVVANFEKYLISSGSVLHFRKVAKFQRVSSKALRGMGKNLELKLCLLNFSRGIERQKEGYQGTNITLIFTWKGISI